MLDSGKGLSVRVQRFFVAIFATIIAFFTSQIANAQQCGPGMVQEGGQGIISCVPTGPVFQSTNTAEDIIGRIHAERSNRDAQAEALARSWKYGSTAHLKVVDTYSVVAWHPNANDIWAVWENKDSLAKARERVLNACNQTMGGGCEIAAAGKNLAVSMATVDGVVTEVAWDEDETLALMGVMKKCETKWGDRCMPFVHIKPNTVKNVRWDTSLTYLPDASKVHLLDKTAPRVERSSDSATSHLDMNNLEAEAKHFIEKWKEKIEALYWKRRS